MENLRRSRETIRNALWLSRLPFALRAANICGTLIDRAQASRGAPDFADKAIAATARAHDLVFGPQQETFRTDSPDGARSVPDAAVPLIVLTKISSRRNGGVS
jgi:hypothetical protein